MRNSLWLTLVPACLLASTDFSELSSVDKARFLQIAKVRETTIREKLIKELSAYRMQKKLKAELMGYALSGELLHRLEDLPNHMSQEEIREWFDQTYVKAEKDLFFLYPELDLVTLTEVCNMMGIVQLPMPTLVDIKRSELLRWTRTLHVVSQDAILARMLNQTFTQIGSHGDFKVVKKWAREMFLSEDPFLYSCTDNAREVLSQVTDIEGFYALKQRYDSLNYWLNHYSVNPHSDLYRVAMRMQDEMQVVLLYGGDVFAFNAWIEMTFTEVASIYFQYPELEQHQLEQLFDRLSLQRPAPPTEMDQIRTELGAALAHVPSGSPDSYLLSSLYEVIASLGSHGDVFAIQDWYQTYFVESGRSVYFQYVGIDHYTVERLNRWLKRDIGQPTPVDTKYAQVYQWLAILEPRDKAYPLAMELLRRLEKIGSYGSLEEFVSWSQLVVDNEEPIP